MLNSCISDSLGGVFNGKGFFFFFLAEVKDKCQRKGDADVSGKKAEQGESH